jgi:DNA-binding IclR family transcriptional regulator
MGMMARLPKKEVDEIVEANLPRYYRIEGFDETGFRQTIKMAQKNGYGTFDNIILDRTTSGLGVAIMDPTGYPIAGIGTTYLTGWLDEAGQKRCLIELQRAAANIEAKLLR